MEREERIKELARRITNALLECDDFTYEDMACSIAYLVGVLDRLSEKANNTKSGTFAKYVYEMIGSVYKVSSDKPAWRPSTEHPAIEEEIIRASREYAMNKSNEKNTWFVDYKDIEEAFLEGAKFACDYSETNKQQKED